jgi:hypothetical protein
VQVREEICHPHGKTRLRCGSASGFRRNRPVLVRIVTKSNTKAGKITVRGVPPSQVGERRELRSGEAKPVHFGHVRLSTVQVQQVTRVELVGVFGAGRSTLMERTGSIVFTSASRSWQRPDDRCHVVSQASDVGSNSHRPLHSLDDSIAFMRLSR